MDILGFLLRDDNLLIKAFWWCNKTDHTVKDIKKMERKKVQSWTVDVQDVT